jgi:hypothetical protein
VALHGAWDASYGWAIMATNGLDGHGWTLGWPNTEAWIGTPAGGTLVVFQIVYTALLAAISLVGAIRAVRRWQESSGG